MATFLNYAEETPAAASPRPFRPAGPPKNPAAQAGAAHPAVLSYLANGSPHRQSYMELLSHPVVQPPNQTAPPPEGGPLPGSPYTHGADVNFQGGPTGPHLLGGYGPTSGAAPGATPFGGPGAAGLDYSSDPILQKYIAAMDAAMKTTRGNAVSDYENLLLGFGSQKMARDFLTKLLGSKEYADAAGVGMAHDGDLPKPIEDIIGGISDNPDTSQSTLGRISRALREATRSTNSNFNKANLFFSGSRGRGLRDLDYENQGQIADATQALQQALTGIGRGVTGTEQQWQMGLMSAEESAYMRALQQALAAASGASGSGDFAGAASEPGGGIGGDGNANYWQQYWAAHQAAVNQQGYWTAGL